MSFARGGRRQTPREPDARKTPHNTTDMGGALGRLLKRAAAAASSVAKIALSVVLEATSDLPDVFLYVVVGSIIICKWQEYILFSALSIFFTTSGE